MKNSGGYADENQKFLLDNLKKWKTKSEAQSVIIKALILRINQLLDEEDKHLLNQKENDK